MHPHHIVGLVILCRKSASPLPLLMSAQPTLRDFLSLFFFFHSPFPYVHYCHNLNWRSTKQARSLLSASRLPKVKPSSSCNYFDNVPHDFQSRLLLLLSLMQICFSYGEKILYQQQYSSPTFSPRGLICVFRSNSFTSHYTGSPLPR